MSDSIDPIDPKLGSLLEGERAPGPATGKDRVRARLEATLFGPGGGGHDGGGSAPAASPSAFAKIAPLATAFVVGSAATALVFSLREPRIEYRDRIVEVPASVVVAPIVTRPSVSAEPVASTSSSAAPHVSAPPSSSGDTIGAERALLDTARTALGRGDGAAALDGIRKHETTFPNGKLTEEREAIAIQALVQLHRGGEARTRAARFAQRYPSSVLLPVVQAALGAAPEP